MPTTTEAPDPITVDKHVVDSTVAALKRANMSTDLKSYTADQLDRAKAAPESMAGRTLHDHILHGTKPKTGRSAGGGSALSAAIKVIEEAGVPMKAKDVAREVIRRKMAPTLKGKTPEATIGAQLYVAAKKPDSPIKKLKAGFVARDAK